jgi:hypothetical protein
MVQGFAAYRPVRASLALIKRKLELATTSTQLSAHADRGVLCAVLAPLSPLAIRRAALAAG